MNAVKPKRFDANLIVIGAGSAGLISALIAATVRAKVTLVEQSTNGRRLSEHRLRAEQDADPFRQDRALPGGRASVRTARRQRRPSISRR